jgi:hypothetical protein
MMPPQQQVQQKMVCVSELAGIAKQCQRTRTPAGGWVERSEPIASPLFHVFLAKVFTAICPGAALGETNGDR